MAGFGYHCLAEIAVDIGTENRGTIRRQTFNSCFANAGRAAGHDDSFST
jgi:hypothetical protein